MLCGGFDGFFSFDFSPEKELRSRDAATLRNGEAEPGDDECAGKNAEFCAGTERFFLGGADWLMILEDFLPMNKI